MTSPDSFQKAPWELNPLPEVASPATHPDLASEPKDTTSSRSRTLTIAITILATTTLLGYVLQVAGVPTHGLTIQEQFDQAWEQSHPAQQRALCDMWATSPDELLNTLYGQATPETMLSFPREEAATYFDQKCADLDDSAGTETTAQAPIAAS